MFSRWFFSQNSTKTFTAQPEGHMNEKEMLRIIVKHTFEALSQLMRVAVNYHRAKTKIKCSTSKEYLGQTTYLRRSVQCRALDCFSKQSSGCFYSHNRIKSFWKSQHVLRGTYFFTYFGEKSMRKVRSESKLESNTAVHVAYYEPPLK